MNFRKEAETRREESRVQERRRRYTNDAATKYLPLLKCEYAPYFLYPRHILNAKVSRPAARQGALLRLTFPEGDVGYADCHPWEELGDLPLKEQLSLLKAGSLSAITSQSVRFARCDALLRSQGKSSFFQNPDVQNNLLLPCAALCKEPLDSFFSQGHGVVKLKMGQNLEKEILILKEFFPLLTQRHIKVRLDFNGVLSFAQAVLFLTAIRQESAVIDFIEDICPFSAQDWWALKKRFAVSLALDTKPVQGASWLTEGHEDCPWDVLVIKPAKENVYDDQNIAHRAQRIVFTSYLDHPLGQWQGLHEAHLFYEKYPSKKEVCGFFTHPFYESHKYADLFSLCENKILLEEKNAYRFDEYLSAERWLTIF